MAEEETPVDLKQGIKMLDDSYVKRVINYLESGALEQSHKDFIKCYT